MKKRFLMFGLGLLAFALIVTLGYSAWKITFSHSQETNPGNITAYGTSDNGQVDIKVGNYENSTFTAQSETIIFGKTDATAGWLALDETSLEDLETYIQVTFTQNGNKDNSGIYSTNAVLVLGNEFRKGGSAVTTYTKASDSSANNPISELIANPTYEMITETNNTYFEFNAGTGVLTIKHDVTLVIKVTYSWGSLFNHTNSTNGNPYASAAQGGNMSSASNSDKQAIFNALTDLNTLVNDTNALQFVITINDHNS